MLKLKLEDSGRKWFGLWVLFLAIIYVLASLGKISWVQWIAVGSGIFLSLFVIGQAGVWDYLRQKRYKSIGFGDIMVWIALFFAGVLFLNSIFLIPFIGTTAPSWIVNFTTGIGVTAGIIVGLLAIFFAFTPKPKA